MTPPDKKSRDLLTELGYDPDDPAMSVEWVPQPEDTPVTATETNPDIGSDYHLKRALRECIEALQNLLAALNARPQ